MGAPSCELAIEQIAQWATDRGLRFEADAFGLAGAVFSADGRRRLLIWRVWMASGAFLGFGMLNPSIAGAHGSDPTADRCTKRGLDMMGDGIGGWLGWNLYDLISTDPEMLRKVPDPVGEHCTDAMMLAIDICHKTIAAWGVGGSVQDREVNVRRMLDAQGVRLHALALTKEGRPRHPLYLPYSAKPQPWDYAI